MVPWPFYSSRDDQDNDDAKSQNNFKSYYKTFNRVCRNDPENPGKMICKETNVSKPETETKCMSMKQIRTVRMEIVYTIIEDMILDRTLKKSQLILFKNYLMFLKTSLIIHHSLHFHKPLKI